MRDLHPGQPNVSVIHVDALRYHLNVPHEPDALWVEFVIAAVAVAAAGYGGGVVVAGVVVAGVDDNAAGWAAHLSFDSMILVGMAISIFFQRVHS